MKKICLVVIIALAFSTRGAAQDIAVDGENLDNLMMAPPGAIPIPLNVVGVNISLDTAWLVWSPFPGLGVYASPHFSGNYTPFNTFSYVACGATLTYSNYSPYTVIPSTMFSFGYYDTPSMPHENTVEYTFQPRSTGRNIVFKYYKSLKLNTSAIFQLDEGNAPVNYGVYKYRVLVYLHS